MEHILIEFIRNNYDNENDRIDIIRRNTLLQLFEDYFKSSNTKLYYLSRALNLKQSIRNKIVLDEIYTFVTKCNKLHLKPIFLKGILLALDIYTANVERRKSSDIDIVIDVNEFDMYYQILCELGYDLYDKYGLNSLDACKELLPRMHLEFTKIVNNQLIHIEIHGSFINPPSLYMIDSNEFIANSQIVQYNDQTLRILSKEYNFIYLILHFMKHIPSSYLHNYLFNNEVYINMSNIHDIALLTDKYKYLMNWDLIVDISIRMKLTKLIYYVCNLVEQIYGEIFDHSFIDKLNQNKEYSFMSPENAEYYGIGKFMWLFSDYIDNILSVSAKDLLLGKLSDKFDPINISIKDNPYSPIIFNNASKHTEYNIIKKFTSDFINEYGTNPSADFEVNINDHGIDLSFKTYYKPCCFYDGEGQYYEKDGFEMILIRNNRIIHRMFTISKLENQIYLIISSHNFNDIIKLKINEDYNGMTYTYDIREYDFSLYISIPWSTLGIDKNEAIIPFNISAVITNPKDTTIFKHEHGSIYNDDRSMWEFCGINYISFKQ